MENVKNLYYLVAQRNTHFFTFTISASLFFQVSKFLLRIRPVLIWLLVQSQHPHSIRGSTVKLNKYQTITRMQLYQKKGSLKMSKKRDRMPRKLRSVERQPQIRSQSSSLFKVVRDPENIPDHKSKFTQFSRLDRGNFNTSKWS